jgi:ribosome biogenesis protein Nip4
MNDLNTKNTIPLVESNSYELTKVDRNLREAAMALSIFGTDSNRSTILNNIIKTKEPYIISTCVGENGEVSKLSISPGAAYGLPKAFDESTIWGIAKFAHSIFVKEGSCPKTINIPIKTLVTNMNMTKCKGIYNSVMDSIKRIDGCTYYQEKWLKINNEGDYYKEKVLKYFSYTERKTVKSAPGLGKDYDVIEIVLPDWFVTNLNNHYTSALNIDWLMKLKNNLAKTLFVYLDNIRCNEFAVLHFDNICKTFNINHDQKSHRKRAILTALKDLQRIGFLKSYSWSKSHNNWRLVFGSIKSFSSKKQKTSLTDSQEWWINELVTELNDKKSTNHYRKLVQVKDLQDGEVFRTALQEVKSAIREQKLNKSQKPIENPGAVFTAKVKELCVAWKLNCYLIK